MSDLKGASPEPKTNRRELLHSVGLKSAIGVAGVAAGTVLGNAGTAGAITGEPLTLGRVGNTAGGSTTTIYTGASTTVHAFTFADNSGVVPTDQGTATVVGHSTMLSAGVLGSSVSRGGTGVVASSSGVSGVGLRAAAGGPGGIAISANGGSVGVEARMTPSEDNSGVIVTGARRGISTSATTAFPLSLAPGTQTSGAPAIAARVGDVAVDAGGTIWFCIADGNPGTFRRLGGAATAGSYTPITPTRVYDSRKGSPAAGPISAGGQRVISAARGIVTSTGAPLPTDLIPAGATAITCNLTVTMTVSSGYLGVFPGDAPTMTASTINWTGNGQTIANGLVVKLDNQRRLKIFAGGPGVAAFLIDVSGYYL